MPPAAAAPATSRSADLSTSRPADQPADPPTRRPADDILAEREEDEAEEQLRVEEAATASPALFADLDDDIAVEAEADRFVADDFLLDAAGAASGVAGPALAKTPPASDLDLDPPVNPQALEDDEVTVAEGPSPAFEAGDRWHESGPDVRGASSAHAPSLGYTPAVEEAATPGRSALPGALLVLLALGLGAGGGWFLRGRVSANPPQGQAAATTGTAATNPATLGREFSEQAVAPAVKPGAPAAPPAANPGGTAATAPREPAAAPPRASTARPAPSTGTLVVRSTPSGAGVTVNGRWRGRTPLTLDELPLRNYDVRVVQSGFEPATESVALTSGAPERTLALRLQRSRGVAAKPSTPAPPDNDGPSVYTGSIYVDSRPRGARVSVDGRAVGITPLRVPDVRIGTHVVRLELPDHRIWSSTATVTAGQERRVTGSLERIQ
jgi:hypothetical protein